MTQTAITYTTFQLPASIVTKLDLARLVSEAERIDDALTTAEIRARTGAAALPAPAVSIQFIQFLQVNKLSMEGPRRAEVLRELRQLKDKAPVVHMTFAVTADIESLQQLANWLRQSVHAHALIEVGLQPALVAGVYMRTTNHVHDFSLRGALAEHREELAGELETLRVGR